MSTVSATATAPSTQTGQHAADLQADVHADADRILATIQPRTWSFTSSLTGEKITVRCMPGCTLDHAEDSSKSTHPEDIYCQLDGDDIELPLFGPLCTTGRPEEFRVLAWHIGLRQYATQIPQRLPYASIEFLEDHWIEGLDPDALAIVIAQLQRQVDSLQRAHAELTAVRAAYRQMPEVTA